MASRFSFTERTFNEIKQMMAAGKPYRVIGEKYDLGHSTLTTINKADDFAHYKRLATIRKHNRNHKAELKAKQERELLTCAVAVAIVEAIIILILLGRA